MIRKVCMIMVGEGFKDNLTEKEYIKKMKMMILIQNIHIEKRDKRWTTMPLEILSSCLSS